MYTVCRNKVCQFYLRQGGYTFVFLCLSVSRITQIVDEMRCVNSNERIDFSGDLNQDADPGIIKGIFTITG